MIIYQTLDLGHDWGLGEGDAWGDDAGMNNKRLAYVKSCWGMCLPIVLMVVACLPVAFYCTWSGMN